jgi:hypothetical protein
MSKKSNGYEENKFNQWAHQSQAREGTVAPASQGGAIAGSDALANAGFKVGFHHIPSKQEVSFKAFISSFQENYASDWASETVFGRPDALHMYKNTSRSLSMSIKVPAATISEGYDNLARVQRLVQFLYPTYTDVEDAQTISQSPLLRLKVMNLITDSKWQMTTASVIGEFASQDSWGDGLLGIMSNLAISHNLDNSSIGVFEVGTGTILPKMIEITFDFKAIHEIPLGWDSKGRFSQGQFPYSMSMKSLYHKVPGDGTSTGGSTTAEEEREEIAGNPPSEQSLKNRVAAFGKAMQSVSRTNRAIRQVGREFNDGDRKAARKTAREYRKDGHRVRDRYKENLD